ncbi:MFS transporter [Kribbella sp. NPDC051770]|uniref:MFS transporter n=1 Tax=Kribbella sp. NPDC051770 TaxID=3155413 RepID=UPI003444162D
MRAHRLIDCRVHTSPPDALIRAFVRWNWARAVLHNGWWLVTSVYLVVDAGLSAAQIVAIGAVQGIFALCCEVPAGVLADTVSRKWSLVVSQVLMGTAMVATGLVTSFALLLATQVLWGLAWTFASGSDVAWITDELDDPGQVSGVLARTARAQLSGAATGLVLIGALAWATRREVAIVGAGTAMLLLSLYVVTRFSEHRFVPATGARWAASWTIFRQGVALVRGSPDLLRIFLATFLVNGATDAAGRLAPKQLLDLGLPIRLDPIVWFTGLGFLALVLGALTLRIAGRRLDGEHARHSYGVAAVVGTAGALGLAVAPNAATGAAALILVSGIAVPLTRVISTIWVNARTTSGVRATTHSFLAQAEYLGEVVCGLLITLVAHVAGLPAALAGGAALFAVTAAIMRRPRRTV